MLPSPAHGQCCAGGSGSPIAGDAAQGVLQEHQMELNTNYQFIHTDKFYKQDKLVAERTFDGFQSQYQYLKVAYGLTKELTLSLENGYYLMKKEVGYNQDPRTTYTSTGVGDLIIFPKYNVYRRETRKSVNEVTVGLGYKVPLGSYNDSVGNIEPFSGQTFYVTKPTAVQLSSGAQDLLFHAFLHHGFQRSGLKLFASGTYILKGWNPNAEKLGDFASVAVYASRTFLEHIGLTLQARYEHMAQMQVNESVLLFGRPSNYFPEATGYSKLFFTPQVSYTQGKFTVYATTDLPLYQSMNTSEHYTQVGSQNTTTVGLSFRFFTKRPGLQQIKVAGSYVCPMHPEEVSDGPAKCTKCGMDLERAQ
ncbi:MAG: hypothetical protein KBH07_00305 [Flavobacteriales bacterium]|nr:hypothetical protein [Flavobacteriales bacterium]MBP9080845.1 hypothetical protein [Flavobacteriales bacterium]